ncbi:MAG: tRNA-dihydrouridine synthase family protein [Muribaculaceae bacterium]|nr:tRNA-dihydrouridine synthase family protein [Muribaculaceae bacterium]MDE6130571.1 tRNA-dihydrouridine synthase family protein [Muribaculaceae bacterium]
MKLFVAPLQGYTDAHWRHWHSRIFGGADCYFTPFLRIEKGEVCRRTMRDISSALNDGLPVVPQIIFRDAAEFELLRNALVEAGAVRIDLNMGCPFPPQMLKGRGSGILAHPDRLAEVAGQVRGDNEVVYSVKMRLGADSPEQWREVAGLLDSMPLKHVAVHPRYGRQQYRGELYDSEFALLASTLHHPLVYNGEISSPDDIHMLQMRYPGLYGVMAGRGLLARPSLFVEYAAGCEWTAERRKESHLKLHDALLEHYSGLLCGDHQLLARMKTFWDYAPDFIDRRSLKRIQKSVSLSDYRAALAQ